MNAFSLTYKSLMNRKVGFMLSVLLIGISVFLLLGIERIRVAARESFSNTISGVDVIVGGRTSPLNLVLFSVFRIGDATNNVSYETFQKFSKKEGVRFSIPISLGDSHKGFRVIGTNTDYFQYYQFSGARNLSFKEGQAFSQITDAVIGSDVAMTLKYKIGDQITLSHGTGQSFQTHENQYFTVVGILNKTSTPVDKSVHVSLEAIEAIHVGWETGAPGSNVLSSESMRAKQFTPTAITAFFLGLENRRDVLSLSREINDYNDEALTAAIPGIELFNLWKTLGYVEVTLLSLSFLVFLSSLVSLFLVLLSSLKERRREMAILRSLGATPLFVFKLYLIESLTVTLLGVFMGTACILFASIGFGGILYDKTGLQMNLLSFGPNDFQYIVAMILTSLLVGIIPAIKAYRNSVSDGLIVRV